MSSHAWDRISPKVNNPTATFNLVWPVSQSFCPCVDAAHPTGESWVIGREQRWKNCPGKTKPALTTKMLPLPACSIHPKSYIIIGGPLDFLKWETSPPKVQDSRCIVAVSCISPIDHHCSSLHILPSWGTATLITVWASSMYWYGRTVALSYFPMSHSANEH